MLSSLLSLRLCAQPEAAVPITEKCRIRRKFTLNSDLINASIMPNVLNVYMKRVKGWSPDFCQKIYVEIVVCSQKK